MTTTLRTLLSTNFIFDATTARNRTAYLAYFSAGVGIASALTGGLLIGYMSRFLDSPILGMSLLSGCLRLLLAALFLPHIREVRRVRSLRSAELFHIMLGGKTVHRPAHHGTFHHHLHGHGGTEDESAAHHAAAEAAGDKQAASVDPVIAVPEDY